jgi:hypothetical protein
MVSVAMPAMIALLATNANKKDSSEGLLARHW